MTHSPHRVAAATLVVATALAGCGLNASSTREEMAQARWADVQAEDRNRARLTADMVGALQGAAAPQDIVMLRQIGARVATPVPAPDAPTDPVAFRRYQASQLQLTRSLAQLEQIATHYPQLQSTQSFVVLRSRLEGSKGRIAVARNDYNEAAGNYNAALGHFPASLWSGDREKMQVFTPEPSVPGAGSGTR